jgi:hypothetical protein
VPAVSVYMDYVTFSCCLMRVVEWSVSMERGEARLCLVWIHLHGRSYESTICILFRWFPWWRRAVDLLKSVLCLVFVECSATADAWFSSLVSLMWSDILVKTWRPSWPYHMSVVSCERPAFKIRSFLFLEDLKMDIILLTVFWIVLVSPTSSSLEMQLVVSWM